MRNFYKQKEQRKSKIVLEHSDKVPQEDTKSKKGFTIETAEHYTENKIISRRTEHFPELHNTLRKQCWKINKKSGRLSMKH